MIIIRRGPNWYTILESLCCPNIAELLYTKHTVCFGALLNLYSDSICFEDYDIDWFFLFGDILNELRNDFSVEFVKVVWTNGFQAFPIFLLMVEFSENFSAGEVIEVGEGGQTENVGNVLARHFVHALRWELHISLNIEVVALCWEIRSLQIVDRLYIGRMKNLEMCWF